MLYLPTPVRLNLPEKYVQLLKPSLTCTDLRQDFEIQRLKKNQAWFVQKHGLEAYNERLDELKAGRKKCFIFQDLDGTYWTYSGFLERVKRLTRETEVQVGYKIPEVHPISWNKIYEPRIYQTEARDLLLEAKHGGVEYATGLGKTYCLAMLLREIGLPAVVAVPTQSIARQLLKDLIKIFGPSQVGLFGDGKKQSDRRFVVGIAASLNKIDENSEYYQDFINRPIMVIDESHLFVADTLVKISLNLMARASYRFFFSGTQIRTDGLDLLLEGVTGPIVSRINVAKAVENGWLAKPVFRMIEVGSKSTYRSTDPLRMAKRHFYYNAEINKKVGEIANKSVELLNRPVLILIDEVAQFRHILPYLKHKVGFAHGGLTKNNREEVPEDYWKSDPEELVNQFNQHKLPILVGTSCISTGTDTKATGTLIYLVGGKSEIQVRQGVGRATRGAASGVVLTDGTPKTDAYVFDFIVKDAEIVTKHALARKAIYEDISPGEVQVIHG